ncbi:MAG: hypothetical protein WCG25_05770, partial [bacterium]
MSYLDHTFIPKYFSCIHFISHFKRYSSIFFLTSLFFISKTLAIKASNFIHDSFHLKIFFKCSLSNQSKFNFSGFTGGFTGGFSGFTGGFTGGSSGFTGGFTGGFSGFTGGF